ncbi:metalloendoproteinase 5-MMP-like [Abrus precatorius]|uniref:Metalloendoproteinase 5-MMP-like n=1 Tax=Abrus precatorius TaxID=3816 RepID=A0A8B8KTD4_ABRPR|nr:metalloendoproteinase 5-MMP-like [Abrus precatorius]
MTKPHPYYFILAFAISFFLTNAVVSARLFPNVSSLLPANEPLRGAWDAFRNLSGCHRGKNYDGLASLKSYFQHFGYIPHAPPSNFSDEFDDALESAIKTYQKNFNLNVTGVLDDDTLRQIVLPRCGVADIINGTSTMNAGKANQTTSFGDSKPRFRTVSHFTLFPGRPRWPAAAEELTYSFFPGNDLSQAVKGVFAAAFARWSEVSPLKFRETASYYSADITIGFFSGDHGDGEPFDGILGTLAHAFSPTNGRFHLDAAEDWVVAGEVTKSALPTAVDLESVAVHEIGHLLGLGHSSKEEAVMFPTISSRKKKVVLAEDDIQGIQFLYGSNPNYNGSTATSAPERDSSDGGRCLTCVGSSWGFLTLLTFAFSHFAFLDLFIIY